MKRVEFRLSMPSCGSWNGKWSGAGKNYSIVRKMSDAAAEKLLPLGTPKSWWHRWDDGWAASVDAHIVAPGVRLKKSDGFSGYDWMVTNIILYGSTEKPKDVQL